MAQSRQDTYRLAPHELSALLAHIRDTCKKNSGLVVAEGVVNINNSTKSYNQLVNYFTVGALKTRQFVIFNISKDAETQANTPQLPYIGDLLREFLTKNERYAKSTLLIPMLQCRGFAKLQLMGDAVKRQHIILVEIDLALRKITAHDSQTKIRYRFYPDKLKDIAKGLEFQYKPKDDYHAYGMQSDESLCGWYVHQYIIDTLNKGVSKHLNQVVLKQDNYENKEEYIKKYIPDWVSQESNGPDRPAVIVDDDWSHLDDEVKENGVDIQDKKTNKSNRLR
jgi:hypothetical protein